jgi:hypothetical protein
MAQRFPEVQDDGTWTDDPQHPEPQDKRLIDLRVIRNVEAEDTDTTNE